MNIYRNQQIIKIPFWYLTDGGSIDGTQQIIEKFKVKLAYYVSEPDKGMYDAINKGFEKSSGDIIAWINADDVYMPWTLKTVNEVFTKYPETQWLGGKYAFLNEDGTLAQFFPRTSIRCQKDIRNGWCREGILGPLQQESMFWRRELYTKSSGLDISYKYAGDFELWTRFAQHTNLSKIDLPLAAFRKRKTSLSKAGREKYDAEIEKAISGKPKYPNILWRLFHKNSIAVQLMRMLRCRSGEIFYYTLSSQNLRKKRVRGNASNHTIQSLLLYK